MSRRQKIALIAGGSAAGVLILTLIAVILVVRSAWFAGYVRGRIVSSVEESTGGKVEVQFFHFAWTHLRAGIHGFVIHGLEPPGAAPLLSVRDVQIGLRPGGPSTGFVRIAYLRVEAPRANVMVFPDGRTNIPTPKVRSNADPLQTVVNLAIGQFDLVDGAATFAGRPAHFNASGKNLRARLTYDRVHPGYAGEIEIDPLLVRSDGNEPVAVKVSLPVAMDRNRITVTNARLTTPLSRIVISGSVGHLNAPQATARVDASVALDDLRRAAGLPIAKDLRGAPGIVAGDIRGSLGPGGVEIQRARVRLGASSFEAHGLLAAGGLRFNASLALAQLARSFHLPLQPEGTVKMEGTVELRPNRPWLGAAKVDARGIALREGQTRLSGIDLAADITAGPTRIGLAALRIVAMGGSFTGSADIQNLRAFRIAGDLRRFDSEHIAGILLGRRLGFEGILSGPIQVDGDLKVARSLVARASLGIAPGPHGIPVAGRLKVDYNARADTVMLGPSYLALPHTRVNLSGALGRRIDVRLVSRDLADFAPLGRIPVTLAGNGTAAVNALVTGSLSNPDITAHAALANFAVEGRPFTHFAGDIAASKSHATLNNAVLARGALQAQLSASVGLRNWKLENYQPLRADVTVRNADLADALALAGGGAIRAAGALTADAHIAGTVGSPTGAADLTVLNGSIEDAHFDSLTARTSLTPQAVNVSSLSLLSGPSRIDATADYQHAVNDLARGTLRARVASSQVQLADFHELLKNRPGLRGIVSLNVEGIVDVNPSPSGVQFQVASFNGSFGMHGLQMEGRGLGDLTATAATSGNAVQYRLDSNFAGSTIQVSGHSLLAGNHETTVAARVANLPIAPALAVAGERDLPLTGTISATGQVSGTPADPHLTAAVTVLKGSAWRQPFDSLEAKFSCSSAQLDLPDFRIRLGPSSLTASGSFAHPAGDYQNGQVSFKIESSPLQLAQIPQAQTFRPGLSGVVQVSADGAARLRKGASPLFARLDADLRARSLSLDHQLGDLTATARTHGQALDFDLTSHLAHADIRGTGKLQLAGDYPIDAHFTFGNVTYAALAPFLGAPAEPIEAAANGTASLSGPLERPDALRGGIRIEKLEARSLPASIGRKPRVRLDLHNAAPIVAALDRSVLTLQSARIAGTFTDIALSGTAGLTPPGKLDLHADGKIRLDLLEAFSPDIYSSGAAALTATVTGTAARPAVNARLDLQNASLNLAGMPAGLSKAAGVITFNGTQAIVQSFTGETGGGKVSLTGVVGFGGPELLVRLNATADRVRAEYPQSIVTESSARLTLTGSTSHSVLSGSVSIHDVILRPRSDVGSLLSQASTPPPVQTAGPGFLAGMHFDIRIATAPDVQFRTTLAQNLQADANLTLRGSAEHPGMIGRITITEGQVVFFGAKYTIDQGSVAFYDPNRIRPFVNIDLETRLQAVDVSLSVSGPMDRLKLTYRSDPPMQFTDLIALLAAGRAPVTDPVLAAQMPPTAQLDFQQQGGGSALFGSAVASPVAGRLQRLFGITSLRLSPQLVGPTAGAQTTLTIQQQITRDVTLTYTQDISQANPDIISLQWDITPQWSVVAQRDYNGFFDLNFLWRKRFH